VLLVLPLIFAELQGNTSKEAPTMLPDDLTPARGNGKVEAALMVPAVVSHNEGSADETAAK
jgi:hypothetical protein